MNAPSASDHWTHAAAFRRELRSLILARSPGPDDARDLAEVAYERAAIICGLLTGSLTGTPDASWGSDAAEALAEGAAAASGALLGSVDGIIDDADVEICWPDGSIRMFLRGSGLNPSDWWRGIACALVARDVDALKVLSEPSHVEALDAPSHTFDAFWLPLCMTCAAVVRNETVTPDLLEQVEKLLAPEAILNADKQTIRWQIAPLLALLRALALRNDFDAALRQALQEFREYAANEDASFDPYRGVPLELLGIAALAHDRGVGFSAADLPRQLVTGEIKSTPLTVTLIYRMRYAQRSEDPTGFLDLRGFPRKGREHNVLVRGEQMIAHYGLRDRDGVPRARAEFQLPGSSPPQAPRALDAGERILLAELYARDPAGIANALDCIDAVLAAIPAGETAVPASEFVNIRGREAYEREPGRFERERLQAYRSGLARSLRPDIKAPALASAELVKEAVRALLVDLANDPNGARAATLKPRPEDYAKVFAPSVVDNARDAFERTWRGPVKVEPARNCDLIIRVAPAGMLAEDNELSWQFPGGYRSVAPLLNPHRVWVAWKYLQRGRTAGVSYDGLVWCDNHWAWFPKPYRVLAEVKK